MHAFVAFAESLTTVLEGHAATHDPLKANPLLGHDRQKLAEPAHVAHSELHAVDGD